MANPYLTQRLRYLLELAKCINNAGDKLSDASKGAEREFFINHILNMVIAPPFRVGSGDITDSHGNRSGQMDIVIEYGNAVSFPAFSSEGPRLFLAEGVCAVIEVKSNLSNQWDEITASHEKVCSLERHLNPIIQISSQQDNKIPYFAVGFRGWSKKETYKKKIEKLNIEGILSLDPSLYYSKNNFAGGRECGSLFAFLVHLQDHLGRLISVKPDFQKYWC